MRRRILASTVSALALAGAAVAAGAPTATADDGPQVEVLAGGLVGPLSLAIGPDGTRWVTEDFASALDKQVPGQPVETVYRNKRGQEVGGVSVEGSAVHFTLTANSGKGGRVMMLKPGGGVHAVASTGAYEKANNPDGDQKYGFVHLSRSCTAQLPPAPELAPYLGIVETHPYNTALVDGTTYVADAAGNDILAVAPDGAIRTVAVLPPKVIRVSADGASANGLPDCTVGKKFRLEPVPTDVEMGPDGDLYVSTLSGGPEDGSLGATGQVLRIDPASGKITRVAEGLLGGTGVTVAPNGDVYASELFGGEIVRIPAGTSDVQPYVSVPLPADLDWSADGLYAVINVLPGGDGPPNGELVRITPPAS